jgi:hypothetical protein
MILTREAPRISSKSGYDWRVLFVPSVRVTGCRNHTLEYGCCGVSSVTSRRLQKSHSRGSSKPGCCGVSSVPSGGATGCRSHTRQDRSSLGAVEYRPSLAEEPQVCRSPTERGSSKPGCYGVSSVPSRGATGCRSHTREPLSQAAAGSCDRPSQPERRLLCVIFFFFEHTEGERESVQEINTYIMYGYICSEIIENLSQNRFSDAHIT